MQPSRFSLVQLTSLHAKQLRRFTPQLFDIHTVRKQVELVTRFHIDHHVLGELILKLS